MFATLWNFQVVTLSPGYPQPNGLVEGNVQTIKQLFKKAYDEGKDAEMALLEFRNTPITVLDQSPAQPVMSRCFHSTLSMTVTMFQPSIYERMRETQTTTATPEMCI